jgi:hypothetical protein
MYSTKQQKLILRGVSLAAPFPTDEKQIARVAKDMIAEHGNAAIGRADQRHQTWVLIREVIRDMQESDAKKSHA